MAFAEIVECFLPDNTAKNDLLFARGHYESGTNLFAQGKFLEAQAQFRAAEEILSNRLRMLEEGAEFLDCWKAQAEIIGQALEYFETDWTNAVREVQAIREPLQEIFRGIRENACDLPAMRVAVRQSLQELDWLSEYVAANNRRDAGTLMHGLQSRVGGQVSLDACGGELRQLLADTTRALAQLEEGLQVRVERENLSSTDDEKARRRRYFLDGTRNSLFIARQMLEQGNALRARSWVEAAEIQFLCKLDRNLDEATLAERDALIREIEELDAAAERILAEEGKP
ncbi:MAG: hypothetical protein IK066_04055 [Kiritimatiellae bacterium]|nr:hypothetical protein [Kiritimatiellia bacterium]